MRKWVLVALAAACLLCAACGSTQHPFARIGKPYVHGRYGGPPPGSPAAGDILYATTGQWSGSPTGFAYQWEDCDSSGLNCSTASGSPTDTPRYQIVSGDAGSTIRVQVTASYAGQPNATIMSPPTGVVASSGAAPVNSAEPIATGTVATGNTVSTTDGSWTNTPTSFTYQWQDCPTDGSACSNITGATSSTYTVASGDAGDVLRATVTAHNAGGTGAATTPMIPFGDAFSGSSVDTNVWTVVHQHGDQSQSEPECYEPSLSTVSSGVFSETLTNSGDSSCPSNAVNPTATASSSLTSGEIQAHTFSWMWGKEFARIKFSAPNGSWPAIWSLTATQCEIPTNLDNCVNTGPDEMDMDEIIADNYTHSNQQLHVNGNNPGCNPAVSPDVYSSFHTYEMDWTSTQVVFKIDGSTTCTLNTSSTWPSESPQFPIIDTAANCSCTGLPTSTQVDWVYITTNSPDNTVLPTLTDTTSAGRFQHGDSISLSNGTWTGSPTGFSYQWHRCDPTVSGNNPPPCSIISGATSSTYTLTTGDEGDHIYGVVTATTSNGGAAAYSAQSTAVS